MGGKKSIKIAGGFIFRPHCPALPDPVEASDRVCWKQGFVIQCGLFFFFFPTDKTVHNHLALLCDKCVANNTLHSNWNMLVLLFPLRNLGLGYELTRIRPVLLCVRCFILIRLADRLLHTVAFSKSAPTGLRAVPQHMFVCHASLTPQIAEDKTPQFAMFSLFFNWTLEETLFILSNTLIIGENKLSQILT